MLLMCAAVPQVRAGGIPIIWSWGGEKIIKVMDLPDEPDFLSKDGKHIDIGYRYKQFAIFLIPIWNYDEHWCGYIGSDSEYLDLGRDDLAAATKQRIPDSASLPLWDSVGGKLAATLVLGLLYWFSKQEDWPGKPSSQTSRREKSNARDAYHPASLGPSTTAWHPPASISPPAPKPACRTEESGMIDVTCTNCKVTLEVPRELEGQMAECPSCHQQILMHRKLRLRRNP